MKRYIKSNSAVVKNLPYYIVYLNTDVVFSYGDYYTSASAKPITKKVWSLEEASNVVMDWIDSTGVGASQFTGGRVEDANGNKVAEISYNGRIWLPGDKYYTLCFQALSRNS